MKSKPFLTIGLLVFISGSAFASAHGPSNGGGGDLACDAKIKAILSNISSWIQGGGPEAGRLDLSSSEVPAKGRSYTLAEYDQAMSTLLRLQLDSSCVTQGDSGYPVAIGDVSKICVSSVSDGQIHLKCDQAKFLGMNPDQQIEQIHHEYAIHVPGLEPDYGAISTYKISLQLGASIETRVERVLVVKAPMSYSISLPFDVVMDSVDGTPMSLTSYDAGRYCESKHARLPTIREYAEAATARGAQIRETNYPHTEIDYNRDPSKQDPIDFERAQNEKDGFWPIYKGEFPGNGGIASEIITVDFYYNATSYNSSGEPDWSPWTQPNAAANNFLYGFDTKFGQITYLSSDTGTANFQCVAN